ncbi:hypothetical protein DPMN_099821 [Dreissena polymorpha]|uniref:Uncharacterized protein n=1 Tax=Dreissena polymorpha TaxID=45954 RepID=A0A9D4LHZ6_DREPO|nr:hypothetical protein DPMN_099821 [Dreissena polymorpha]
MQMDLESVDVETFVFKADKCLEKIKNKCNKLEVQSEKLQEVTEEAKSVQQIIDNDGDLCDQAMECYMDLKHFKDKINSKREQKKKRLMFTKMKSSQ